MTELALPGQADMVEPLELLKLPAEIRLMILRRLLVRKYGLLMCRYNDVRFQGGEFYLARVQTEKRYWLAVQILRTCKQLLHEGLPLLYSNIFDVTSLQSTEALAYTSSSCYMTISESNVSQITRLQIPQAKRVEAQRSLAFADAPSSFLQALRLHPAFPEQLQYAECLLHPTDYDDDRFLPAAVVSERKGLEELYLHGEQDAGEVAATEERLDEIGSDMIESAHKGCAVELVGAALSRCRALTCKVYHTFVVSKWTCHGFISWCGRYEAVILSRNKLPLKDTDIDTGDEGRPMYWANRDELEVDTAAGTVKEISGSRAGFMYPCLDMK